MDPRIVYLFACAFLTSLITIPLIKKIAIYYKIVSFPKKDRWHKKPTPILGGVGIFAACIITASLFYEVVNWNLYKEYLVIPACATAVFLIGLMDDVSEIRPQQKLAIEVVVASIVIFFGFRLHWTGSEPLNMLLSFFWIIGITNAFNLLDNIDGLSAGIAIISGAFILAVNYLSMGKVEPSHPLNFMNLILLGATSGFLIFNFNPASIFMGDAGSLFIGFLLSIFSIKEPSFYRNSSIHLISTVGIPILIMLIPILDTTFVTLMRKLFGKPIYVGGKDHSSHRIVAIGFSEKTAVLILYAFSIIAGVLAILINYLSLWIWTLLSFLFVLSILFFWIKLATVKVYEEETSSALSTLSAYRKVFELLLDLILIIVAYYIAYVLRFESNVKYKIHTFIKSLPVVVATQMVFLYILGIHRSIWEKMSIRELHRYMWAITLGTFSAMLILLFLYRFISFSRALFVIYWGITLILLPLPRLFFYMLDTHLLKREATGEPVVIYGAGIGGQIAVKELETNKDHRLKIIGFIDDNEELHGKRIMGYPVLGGGKDLKKIIEKYRVKKVLISFRKNGEEKKKELTSQFSKMRKQIDVYQMKLIIE